MNSDRKLFKWLGALILMPLLLAIFGGDRFRYPCQDPDNWDKKECKKPYCEVTGTMSGIMLSGSKENQAKTEKAVDAVVEEQNG